LIRVTPEDVPLIFHVVAIGLDLIIDTQKGIVGIRAGCPSRQRPSTLHVRKPGDFLCDLSDRSVHREMHTKQMRKMFGLCSSLSGLGDKFVGPFMCDRNGLLYFTGADTIQRPMQIVEIHVIEADEPGRGFSGLVENLWADVFFEFDFDDARFK
jgi:hypothetical protein